MTYERIVILALLLLLVLALFRSQPGGPSAESSDAVQQQTDNVKTDILNVIHQRKSVRSYTKEPVELSKLHELVRAGFAAPSCGNAKPWAFVIITDRVQLDALANTMPHGKMLSQAPAAIAVCGVSQAFRTGEYRDVWLQDCSAATENILLAAEGTGLGAVWLGVYPHANLLGPVASILKLPEGIIPFSIISVGHPTGVEKPKNKYDPSRLFLQYWGNKFQQK